MAPLDKRQILPPSDEGVTIQVAQKLLNVDILVLNIDVKFDITTIHL